MAITIPVGSTGGRDGRVEEMKLPFVIGVIGDFSGAPDAARPPLRDRRFVSVDRRTLDDLPGAAAPPPETAVWQVESARFGVRHLVSRLASRSNLRIRLADVSRTELRKDLLRAAEPEESWLYRRLAEDVYSWLDDAPMSLLICDHEFTNHPGDVGFLADLSRVGAALLTPVIAAAGPGMFGFADYRELHETRDPEQIFAAPKYTKWRSLRDSDDARYVVLTMPRVMVHRPDERGFDFEALAAAGSGGACSMNAAYGLGGGLAEMFSADEWWTTLDDGEDTNWYGPGQVPIATAQAEALSRAGFAVLCGDDTQCPFILARTVYRPPQFEHPEATAVAASQTRVGNVMATARLAHHVRKAAVYFSKQGFTRKTLERRLNDWMRQYVNKPGETEDRGRPLNDANIELLDHYRAADQCLVRLWMRPNLPGSAGLGTANTRIVFALPHV